MSAPRKNRPKVDASGEPPQLPAAPDVPRRLQVGRVQLIGLPLLALLPLAAMIGVFDPAAGASTTVAGPIELRVEQPTRLRFGRDYNLTLTVRNTSEEPVADVTVAIAQSLLNAFSQVQVSPSVEAIVGQAAEIEIGDIPAGGSASVDVNFRARDMGLISGLVEARAGDSSPARLEISFLVYP